MCFHYFMFRSVNLKKLPHFPVYMDWIFIGQTHPQAYWLETLRACENVFFWWMKFLWTCAYIFTIRNTCWFLLQALVISCSLCCLSIAVEFSGSREIKLLTHLFLKISKLPLSAPSHVKQIPYPWVVLHKAKMPDAWSTSLPSPWRISLKLCNFFTSCQAMLARACH